MKMASQSFGIIRTSLCGRILTGIACLIGISSMAVPITYTLTDNGEGYVGSYYFNGLFTITATADTSQITEPSPGVYNVINLSTTIDVPGLGVATFTSPTTTVDNQASQEAGLIDPAQNLDIFFATQIPALGSYALATSLGQVTGRDLFNSGTASYGTTDGAHSFFSVEEYEATFQATTVPEP